MKRPSRGSHPLARPILIATALVVAGALSTGLTHYQLGLAEQAEHAARSGLRQSEAELQQAEATLQRNRNTASAWDRLRAGEARNSPPRNAWIEALERLRADPAPACRRTGLRIRARTPDHCTRQPRRTDRHPGDKAAPQRPCGPRRTFPQAVVPHTAARA